MAAVGLGGRGGTQADAGGLPTLYLSPSTLSPSLGPHPLPTFTLLSPFPPPSPDLTKPLAPSYLFSSTLLTPLPVVSPTPLPPSLSSFPHTTSPFPPRTNSAAPGTVTPPSMYSAKLASLNEDLNSSMMLFVLDA